MRYGDDALVSMRNPAAALFRPEKSRTPEDIRDAVGNLVDWLKAPEQLNLGRAFTVTLGRVLLPKRVPGQAVPELSDLQEVNAMLTETVQAWTKQWESKGHQEGRQEGIQIGESRGRQEGRREGGAALLRRLLQRRFGTLPEWAETRIAQADLANLEPKKSIREKRGVQRLKT